MSDDRFNIFTGAEHTPWSHTDKRWGLGYRVASHIINWLVSAGVLAMVLLPIFYGGFTSGLFWTIFWATAAIFVSKGAVVLLATRGWH